MRTASLLLPALLALGACRIERAASGRPPGGHSAVDSLAVIEQDSAGREEVRRVLRTYYSRLSSRDWASLRMSFWDNATITTKWQPPGESVGRVEVLTIDQFISRAPEGPDRLAVFSEEPLSMDIHLYGDLAQAWTLYRARFGTTRDSIAVHHGIDAFHLLRHRGVYRIVGLTFVNETPDRPLVPAAPAAAPR